MRSNLGLLALLPAAAVLFFVGRELPAVGDPGSPAATHVAPRYIEQGPHETGAPNMVTGVLADYRGYDTFGELTVILTAGLACLVILSERRVRGRRPRHARRRGPAVEAEPRK